MFVSVHGTQQAVRMMLMILIIIIIYGKLLLKK